MAQETYYFSHDYNPLDDSKLQALIATHGAVGYGVYWRVVEKLHSSDTNILPLKQYLFIAIAKELLTTPDIVSKVITDAVEYELFAGDKTSFWSERVFRNIELRLKKKEQKSKAGKASAKARKKLKEAINNDILKVTDVEQMLTGVQQNLTEVNKGKEIKVN